MSSRWSAFVFRLIASVATFTLVDLNLKIPLNLPLFRLRGTGSVERFLSCSVKTSGAVKTSDSVQMSGSVPLGSNIHHEDENEQQSCKIKLGMLDVKVRVEVVDFLVEHLASLESFEKLLEEIHMTWTQFGKKRDKIAALHKVTFKECVQCLETAFGFVAMPFELTRDSVKTFVTASERNHLNEIVEDPEKRRRHDSYDANLALYDHEGWEYPKDFAKSVKAISLPQNTPKMPDRRLLELEDYISYLLKESRTTPETSSMHIPQAYAKVISLNPFSQNFDEPPRKNSFTFQKRVHLERFEEAIFNQREEINDIKEEMFGLLRELTASRRPEKDKNTKNNKVVDKNIIEHSELNALEPEEVVDVKKEVENITDNEAIKSMKEEIMGEGIK
nr:hypothetical protein [Tanacetum cinerariifolium]